MCRILVKTVLLLGIALAAGWVHSRVIPPLRPQLPVQPAIEDAPKSSPSPSPSPTPAAPPTGPTAVTGATGATAPTGPVVGTANPASTKATAEQQAPQGVAFITVQQAKAIYDKNEAVFVDARTYDEYREGHVPNSMHMDKKYFDGAAGPMKAKALKGQGVVIYCHGAECTDSQAVAQRFLSLNYQIGPIKIIKDGFPGWVAAGYEVAKGGEVNW